MMFALLVVESFYPFEPQLPVWRRTIPARNPATGSVRFDGRSLLVSPSPPGWLVAARQGGRVEFDLEARAERPLQGGPARVLTISRDIHEANMSIGQQDDALVVRVRRHGSDRSGDPAIEVPHLFAAEGWHSVHVLITHEHLRIEADGRVVVDEALETDALAGWDSGYLLALGDEPQGERGWVGELRRVQVTTSAGAVNLLTPGLLEPKRGAVVRTRVRTLLVPAGGGDPMYLVALRVLAFVPIGVALQRLLRRWFPVLLAIVGFSGLLLVGKLFVAGRHPNLVDFAWSIVGGFLGYLFGMVFESLRRRPIR
ncbi:MAG: VanZ family protein [Nitriliruptorales bacterium]